MVISQFRIKFHFNQIIAIAIMLREKMRFFSIGA